MTEGKLDYSQVDIMEAHRHATVTSKFDEPLLSPFCVQQPKQAQSQEQFSGPSAREAVVWDLLTGIRTLMQTV